MCEAACEKVLPEQLYHFFPEYTHQATPDTALAAADGSL